MEATRNTLVLAFAHTKGGTGKTTSTINTAALLADNGFRVLVIDLDPQANTSRGLGVIIPKEDKTIPISYEVLLNSEQGCSYAIQQLSENLHIIPSSKRLSGADMQLVSRFGREGLLREAIREVMGQYDYIFIDTPPTDNLYLLNALVAAHAVIVPVQLQIFAMDALPDLEDTVKTVQKANRGLEIAGILCTFQDKSTRLTRACEATIREQYPELVFKTAIPKNTRLAEAPKEGQSIFDYDSASEGAAAYARFVQELEDRFWGEKGIGQRLIAAQGGTYASR